MTTIAHGNQVVLARVSIVGLTIWNLVNFTIGFVSSVRRIPLHERSHQVLFLWLLPLMVGSQFLRSVTLTAIGLVFTKLLTFPLLKPYWDDDFSFLWINYYLHRGVTDFRCGMHSLNGLVRRELGQDPLNGAVYIFFNRSRTQIKLLLFEGDGFALYQKCLEKGTYEIPTSMIFSLFATCRKHGVDTQNWLTDVFYKINDSEFEGSYSDLMPHRWKNNS